MICHPLKSQQGDALVQQLPAGYNIGDVVTLSVSHNSVPNIDKEINRKKSSSLD